MGIFNQDLLNDLVIKTLYYVIMISVLLFTLLYAEDLQATGNIENDKVKIFHPTMFPKIKDDELLWKTKNFDVELFGGFFHIINKKGSQTFTEYIYFHFIDGKNYIEFGGAKRELIEPLKKLSGSSK